MNTKKLRLINKTCFPIGYSETFYKDVVKSKNENLNKFAYHNGFVVGAICTRIEALPKDEKETQSEGESNNDPNEIKEDKKRIYIMTLGVLAAYRNRGIGQKLVQSILDYYKECKTAAENKTTKAQDPSIVLLKEDIEQMQHVTEMTLHVQISNHDAIKFYNEKFDFEQCEQVDNYYKRIDPPHAFVLRKKL